MQEQEAELHDLLFESLKELWDSQAPGEASSGEGHAEFTPAFKWCAPSLLALHSHRTVGG